MSTDSTGRTLALAGIFQSAWLVQQISRQGMADSDSLRNSLDSVFRLDADSPADVYGGPAGVATGLRQLGVFFSRSGGRPGEFVRYALSLLKLERKLVRQPDMLESIRTRLVQAGHQVELYGALHDNVIANLADIYLESISQLKPRILVNGEPLHLANPDNVNRIRALLLAGIRSAVLWRQCGGNWWQLLLGRRRILEESRRLLAETQAARN